MPIPLIRVEGDHRAVGRQIGEACSAEIVARVEREPGPRYTSESMRALAEQYRAVTAHAYPWLLDELEGVAEGAEVDPLGVFAASIEELWTELTEPPSDAPDAPSGEGPSDRGKCSDLVATPPISERGATLVAHNNDLSPESEARLVALEWSVEGEPRMLTIGIGPWISVGWNAAGLSLTGNELTPNDERVGIPRLLQVRDILRQSSVDDAVKVALHPDRASSYCNLLAHRDGTVVCVEGSASDAELIRPESGRLAHTNHYVADRMLAFEGDPRYARHSAVRYRRARTVLDELAASGDPITTGVLRRALADHADAPDSLCRHTDDGASSKTVFWCVADVSAGRIAYGRGNPCDSVDQEYAFASR
jgi:isopenicillin-N N-acyltransferase-like protein